MAPDTDPKEVEAEKFARELVSRLEKGRVEHEFERFAVVAPPHFLGMLKAMLPKELSKHLDATVSKDLTHESEPQVRAHVHAST